MVKIYYDAIADFLILKEPDAYLWKNGKCYAVHVEDPYTEEFYYFYIGEL